MDFESSTAAGLTTSDETFFAYKPQRNGDMLDTLFGMIEAYLRKHPPNAEARLVKANPPKERKAKVVHDHGEETVRDARTVHAGTYLEPDKTFRWTDSFNVIMGMIEGSMGAVDSNIYSFQCSRNSTAVRADVQLMIQKTAQKERTDAVTYFTKVLNRVDDLTINCV